MPADDTSLLYALIRAGIPPADAQAVVNAGLGGGITALNAATDYTSAPLATANTSIATALAGKANTFATDATPTSASANPVQSGGVFTVLAGKAPAFVAPSAASTRSISNADNLATLTAASAVTLTVPAGLTPGLSLTVIGAGVVTWAGSGATVTDQRNTGSTNPICTLICTGTDTYVVRGEKA